jgi:outer membrane immunogenic protein
MRNLAVALAGSTSLIASLVQFASAADLPSRLVPAPPIAYTAPRVWTGYYIGAHAGGGWGAKDWTTNLGAAVFVDDWQHAVNGFLGGAQLGANYQFDRWVIGAEAQFSWSNLEGKSHCPITGRDLNCSTKTDWLGTAALRLGLTAGDALVYVKGGAAWARDEYTFRQFVPNAISSASDTRWGWMFGTGVEYAVSSNWSAKVEYNYLDFGTDTVHFPNLGTALSIQSLNSDVFIRQRIHLIKAGINYRFDWSAPSVAARY